MAAISTVLVHCGRCRMRFPCPLPIPDLKTFEGLASSITALKCSLCNRFVSVTGTDMTCVFADEAEPGMPS